MTRTDTTNDNKLVFYMSNIMPQSGTEQSGRLGNLESYCNTLATAGNELLLLCGPSGFGANKIPSGKGLHWFPTSGKSPVIVPLGTARLEPLECHQPRHCRIHSERHKRIEQFVANLCDLTPPD